MIALPVYTILFNLIYTIKNVLIYFGLRGFPRVLQITTLSPLKWVGIPAHLLDINGYILTWHTGKVLELNQTMNSIYNT
jgi:hypothetical protein